MTPALELTGVRKRFGGVTAANDISLRLAPGSRHALIGPNGAGKTTLVNLITGALLPDGGTIHLFGRDVTRRTLGWRVRRGLAQSFQITSLFASFAVFEIIALAIAERDGRGWSLRTARGVGLEAADEAERIAGRLGLADVGVRRVSELPYGQQRLVELAVVLALRPRVLLLDEPAAGLSANDHDTVLAAIAALPDETAVLLIEHDLPLVFRFATEITVLAAGTIVASGPPQAIKTDARVRAAYLGPRDV